MLMSGAEKAIAIICSGVQLPQLRRRTYEARQCILKDGMIQNDSGYPNDVSVSAEMKIPRIICYAQGHH